MFSDNQLHFPFKVQKLSKQEKVQYRQNSQIENTNRSIGYLWALISSIASLIWDKEANYPIILHLKIGSRDLNFWIESFWKPKIMSSGCWCSGNISAFHSFGVSRCQGFNSPTAHSFCSLTPYGCYFLVIVVVSRLWVSGVSLVSYSILGKKGNRVVNFCLSRICLLWDYLKLSLSYLYKSVSVCMPLYSQLSPECKAQMIRWSNIDVSQIGNNSNSD